MIKLIILDRDGVINQDSSHFIKSPEEWIPIPGSLEAIAKLTQHGYKVVVASNQSGIGRKLFSLDILNEIHEKMHDAVQAAGGFIDKIFFCPHLPEDKCLCRKPLTGLFEEIARNYQINYITQKIPAIGDSLRDLEAALNAGAYPILVETGNGKKTLSKISTEFTFVEVYPNLLTAVDAILNNEEFINDGAWMRNNY